MSDELAVKMALTFTKGGVTERVDDAIFTVDVTGNNYSTGTLDLTTAYEAIPLGDVATVGFCYFRNLGTDDVAIREDLTGDPRIVLKSGEAAITRLDDTGFGTPGAKAVNTTSRLKFLVIED